MKILDLSNYLWILGYITPIKNMNKDKPLQTIKMVLRNNLWAYFSYRFQTPLVQANIHTHTHIWVTRDKNGEKEEERDG